MSDLQELTHFLHAFEDSEGFRAEECAKELLSEGWTRLPKVVEGVMYIQREGKWVELGPVAIPSTVAATFTASVALDQHLGWTRGFRSGGAQRWHQDTKCITEFIDGQCVISENDTWIPGVYGSFEAAKLAFSFRNWELQELQDGANHRNGGGGAGVITLDDLQGNIPEDHY